MQRLDGESQPREMTINNWQTDKMQRNLNRIKTNLERPFFQHKSEEREQLLREKNYLEQELVYARAYLAQVERYHSAINALENKINEEKKKLPQNNTAAIVDVLDILEKFGLAAINEYQSIAELNENLTDIASNERLQDLTDGVKLLTNQLNVITAPTVNISDLNNNQEKIDLLCTKLEETKCKNKYMGTALYAASVALFAAGGMVFLGSVTLAFAELFAGMFIGLTLAAPLTGFIAGGITSFSTLLLGSAIGWSLVGASMKCAQAGTEALDKSTHHSQTRHMRFFNGAVKHQFNNEGAERSLADTKTYRGEFSCPR